MSAGKGPGSDVRVELLYRTSRPEVGLCRRTGPAEVRVAPVPRSPTGNVSGPPTTTDWTPTVSWTSVPSIILPSGVVGTDWTPAVSWTPVPSIILPSGVVGSWGTVRFTDVTTVYRVGDYVRQVHWPVCHPHTLLNRGIERTGPTVGFRGSGISEVGDGLWVTGCVGRHSIFFPWERRVVNEDRQF